jgi:hypothetical protein
MERISCHAPNDGEQHADHEQHRNDGEGLRRLRTHVLDLTAHHPDLQVDQFADLARDRIDDRIEIPGRVVGQRSHVLRADDRSEPVYRGIGGRHQRLRLIDQRLLFRRHLTRQIGPPVLGDQAARLFEIASCFGGVDVAVAQLVRGIDDVDGVHVGNRLQLLGRNDAILVGDLQRVGRRLQLHQTDGSDRNKNECDEADDGEHPRLDAEVADEAGRRKAGLHDDAVANGPPYCLPSRKSR